LTIFNADDWREFNVGYTRYYYDTDRWGMRYGEKKKEFVEMSLPRPCSYSSKTDYDGDVKETTILGKPSYDSSSVLAVEQRGITLRQLRAVWANIVRRCVLEGWTDYNGELLKPEDVTLYDAHKYVIRPFTVEKKTSFVRALPSTAGSQPPRFFISHWWGCPVIQFMQCLEQAVLDFRVNCGIYGDQDSRGGGMTADTPVWVCAYVIDQWDLIITFDPRDKVHIKAMQVAEWRMINIMDKEGTCFDRIWNLFEINQIVIGSSRKKATEKSKDGVWAVYTHHSHSYKEADNNEVEERNAVGIILGGTTSDLGIFERIFTREAPFPFESIKKSLTRQVENITTYNNHESDDKRKILNCMIGQSLKNLNDDVPASHEKYDEFNNIFSGSFASSAASLQRVGKESDEGWKNIIKAFSKGSMRGELYLDFNSDGVFGELSAVRAIQLVTYLPLTIDRLIIADAQYGAEFMEALIERVKQLHRLKELTIEKSSVGGEKEGQEIGLRLVKTLSTNTTIERLSLWDTNFIGQDNVKDWGAALMKNNTLTELNLKGIC